jgi:hypothetical protein
VIFWLKTKWLSFCTIVPVCDFLAKNKMAVFLHSPSSPDLAPCDFLLLPELSTPLKGRGGSDITILQAEL